MTEAPSRERREEPRKQHNPCPQIQITLAVPGSVLATEIAKGDRSAGAMGRESVLST
jgi:hypothetical protein